MNMIYKTELFQDLWDQKAKENLDYELFIKNKKFFCKAPY